MNRTILWTLMGAFLLLMLGASVMAGDGRIFIGDDDKGDHVGEAKVTEGEAITIAEDHTGGTAESAELENENGYLVWGVIVSTANGRYDVKIDAGTGEVLKVESDD